MTRLLKIFPGLIVAGFLLAQSSTLLADSSIVRLSDNNLDKINAGVTIETNAGSSGIIAIVYGESHAASYGIGAIGAGASIACCGNSNTSVSGNGTSILNITIPIKFIGASVSIGINNKFRKRRNRRR